MDQNVATLSKDQLHFDLCMSRMVVWATLGFLTDLTIVDADLGVATVALRVKVHIDPKYIFQYKTIDTNILCAPFYLSVVQL